MLYRVINGRLRVRGESVRQGGTVEMTEDEAAVALSVGVVEAVSRAIEAPKAEPKKEQAEIPAPVNSAVKKDEAPKPKAKRRGRPRKKASGK